MTRLLQGRSGRFALAILAALAGAAPAIANDSTAELGAGGLQLIHNDVVTLLSEDLYISPDRVSVAYRFINTTDAPATFLVAFPLPSLDAMEPDHMNLVLPEPARDNFVDFSVTVNGKAITPKIAARASIFGVDRTALLRQKGLPLNPFAEGIFRKLKALPADDVAELNRAGLVTVQSGQIEFGLAPRPLLLLGADLPARQGSPGRASLPAGCRLQLLRPDGRNQRLVPNAILH